MKYGPSPDKQYYFICPRYWNFKTNKPVRPDDVDPKHLIKPGTDRVKNLNEKFIFEFSDKSGKYTKKYPGFIEGFKHPKGFCAPCCFGNVYTPKHIETRKQCNAAFNNEKYDKENQDEHSVPLTVNKKNKDDKYIKGPDKFPLADSRLGHLMPSLEGFLNFNSLKCMVSTKTTKIKDNHPCILRYGVEFNEQSSFVSCISSLYEETNDTKLTNREMREYLSSIINIDNILELHNGNIVKLFDNKNYDSINLDDFKDTKMYKSLIQNAPILLYQLINSVNNFKDFLNDSSLTIDHTYLWDLVCKPNEKLFKTGINLVILQDNEDSDVNNIDILCPPNSFSKYYFDINKPSLILYKKNNFYEPLVNFEVIKNKKKLSKLFYVNNDKLPELYKILSKINILQKQKCLPKELKPSKEYPFKHNIPAHMIINILSGLKIPIIKQIINYDMKVIGLIIEHKNIKVKFLVIHQASMKIYHMK